MVLAFLHNLRSVMGMPHSEDAWKALQQTHDLIKVAATKAAAIVTGNGVLGGVLLKALPPHSGWASAWPHVALLLGSLAAVSASILCALLFFLPRLRNDRQGSLLYFGTVARRYAVPAEFVPAYRKLLSDGPRLEKSPS